MKYPKFSIITVCFNAVNYIAKTIDSVIDQTYPNIEYIVVDGKSADGTTDIIYRYSNSIDVIISEPDNGIYDAMNKGIKSVTGDWVIFLNAGDFFVDKLVLQKIITNNLEKIDKADVVFGNSVQVFRKFRKIKIPFSVNFLRQSMPFSHQCVFVKKRILQEHPFSNEFKLAADYEFFLYCFLNNANFLYIPIEVSCINLYDGATAHNFKKSQQEAFFIRKKYGCFLLKNYIYYGKCMIKFRISNFLNWLR